MLINFLNVQFLVLGTFFALTNFASLAQSKKSSCSKITCEEPTSKEKPNCEIVSEDDDSLPAPSGPNAKCCPLWKCVKKNGDFYTIHGNEDGKEVVEYSKDGKLVTSIATGNHDAISNAGGKALDIQDALTQMNETFRTFKNQWPFVLSV